MRSHSFGLAVDFLNGMILPMDVKIVSFLRTVFNHSMATDDKRPNFYGSAGDGYPNAREPVTFECPVCGCRDFEKLRVDGKDGRQSRDTELFECLRCTVIFHQWARFSKRRD